MSIYEKSEAGCLEDLAHASHTRHREAGRVHTFITGRTFDFTMLANSPPKAPAGMFPAPVPSGLIGFYALQRDGHWAWF